MRRVAPPHGTPFHFTVSDRVPVSATGGDGAAVAYRDAARSGIEQLASTTRVGWMAGRNGSGSPPCAGRLRTSITESCGSHRMDHSLLGAGQRSGLVSPYAGDLGAELADRRDLRLEVGPRVTGGGRVGQELLEAAVDPLVHRGR